MKHLFTKLMVIVAMLFAGSALMTACTPDQGDDYNGPPVLEVGEPNVINALKVEIPITAKKLTSVGYKVVAEGENAPASAMMVFRSGSKVNGNPSKITLTGNDGLDLDKTFTVYIVATISDTEFYNNGEMFTVQFTTPNNYVDDFVYVKRTMETGAEVVVNFPPQLQGKRIKWGIANIAMLEYYGQAPIPAKLHSNDQVYPASLIARDTTLMITHNMKDAIRLGNRLIMMHEGRIIYEVSGEEKQKLQVSDLMALFAKASDGEFANDRMLLG